MGKSTERPRPSTTAIDLSQTREVLKKLLAIELVRLDTAVRIEKERNIVFPETTVIIRDIQKLTAAINGKPVVGNGDASDTGDPWDDIPEMSP